MAKKKVSLKKAPPPAKTAITQRKRDQVASIFAIVIGLLSVREGGAVLLGVTNALVQLALGDLDGEHKVASSNLALGDKLCLVEITSADFG